MNISSIQETTYNKLGVQKSASFSGINVHIVDGGAHGQNMTHYAHSLVKTINEDIFIQTHKVKVNKISTNLKQMGDLESVLKNMNESGHLKRGDYITISGLATVPLSTLSAILESFIGRIR